MTTQYEPPFKITAGIVSLISEISEMLGRLAILEELSQSVRLRRINKIRTIQGSLAIEGNTLSLEQITAILNGKRVLAPPREILEVKNAIKVYERFLDWQPYAKEDLLAAHELLMSGLLDKPGQYRTSGVGVMSGEVVVHLAPSADRIRYLMNDLLDWLKTTNQHPLISSSVFHCEFEFIHPFADGNGRMGRLWQTLILSRWNPFFANIPVESIIYENQQEYYQALNKSTANGESSVFIEFMLNVIRDTVKAQITPEVAPQDTPEVSKLIITLDGEMSRKEILLKLNLKDEKHLRQAYLHPAMDAGLIEMTKPDKPNSSLQKYRLTANGWQLKQSFI